MEDGLYKYKISYDGVMNFWYVDRYESGQIRYHNTVGKFKTEEEARKCVEERVKEDQEYLEKKRKSIEYWYSP